MALTKEERQKLDETHETVNNLKTVLIGMDGHEGLVGEFRKVAESHYKLKRLVYLVLGILIGSGVLGGGIWSILNFG